MPANDQARNSASPHNFWNFSEISPISRANRPKPEGPQRALGGGPKPPLRQSPNEFSTGGTHVHFTKSDLRFETACQIRGQIPQIQANSIPIKFLIQFLIPKCSQHKKQQHKHMDSLAEIKLLR